MGLQSLRAVMDEIHTRQENLDTIYDGTKYSYGIYEPGTTFLRYLITNFKLQLYSSLWKKHENLDSFLHYYNIYFLVEDGASAVLKIYPTRDQIHVANHKLSENTAWFFKKEFGGGVGLASQLFKQSCGDKYTYTHSVSPWYTVPVYNDYKDLNKELKIFGIDEGKSSVLHIFAWEHVELILVLTGESPNDFEDTCKGLIEGTHGNFIKMLNREWARMIYDQKCWYDTWVDEKTKMDKQVFESTYHSVNKRIDIYLNDKNPTTDEIRNIEEKSKNEFTSLVNELKKIGSYCSDAFGEPKYSRQDIRAAGNFYTYPGLAQGNEEYLQKFGNTCIELCKDFTNDPKVASHNLIHTVNMEKIALSWGGMMNDADLRGDFPNLLKAIWLHYVILTKYASTNKNLEFEEYSKYDAIYPLGAKMLAELKDRFDLKTTETEILKTLVQYHSRTAPLTGQSEEIECNGTIKIDPLEGKIGRLPAYPYFLMVILFRLMDSIDVQWNRCGQYKINHSKKRLEEAQTPIEEPLHFFKHAYFGVNLDCDRKEVVYEVDYLSPLFLILYAFAEVIIDMEKELNKVNQECIVEKIRQDWTTLTGNSSDGDLEIGLLKLRGEKFDVDASLQGIPTDFSKEGWWDHGGWPIFNSKEQTEQMPKLGEGGKREGDESYVKPDLEKKAGEPKEPEVGLSISNAKEDREDKQQKNSPIPTEIVHISDTQETIVRIAVVQFCFELTEVFPLVLKNKDEVKTKVFSTLDIATQNGAHIVCLPELCLCKEWISEIKKKYTNMIIIGGSFYKDYKNLCPVIIGFNDKIPYQPKITPSTQELPKMIPGDRYYIYETQFGKFMVLICRDFYKSAHHYREAEIDMIFCPSCNRAYNRFHDEAFAHVQYVPSYIMIANTGKYGGTSIFGQLNKDHFNSLVDNGCKDAKERESKKLIYKLCEVKKGQEEMIIADFNLIQKSVQLTPADPTKEERSVDNIKKISIRCCSESVGDSNKV